MGQQLQAESLFKAGDLVDVQGTSIGKGFQGGVKRHGFARGLMSHGSKSHRAPGAIGGNTAGRVFAFQRMPGQMGNVTVKVRKLEVVRVTSDSILVKGSVPGKPGNIIRITPAKVRLAAGAVARTRHGATHAFSSARFRLWAAASSKRAALTHHGPVCAAAAA